MTSPIVGLIGHKQAGKDTLAAYLVAGHGYTRVAFADALKRVTLKLNPWVAVPVGHSHHFRKLADLVRELGWDGAKQIPEVRVFLQELGVAVRDEDEDFWVRTAMAKMPSDSPVVVTDVRFPNEVTAVSAQGSIVRVTRHDADEAAAHDPHISEHALDGYEADLTVDNNGSLDDLETQAAAVAAYANTKP